jgi:two-component system chemotaxis response regulator CheB
MINVLIVEDSPVIQELLVYILDSDPEIHIAGIAGNGEEAINMVKEKKPDVITMDIHMPKLDGIAATRKIMETYPTPIIVVSSSCDFDEVTMTFRAMEAGALTVIRRPSGVGHPDFQATASAFTKTIKLMSEVKVVKRWAHYTKWKEKISAPTEVPLAPVDVRIGREIIQVVAIGASTGGPVVLQTILSGVGKSFSVPLLIVQHIASGFLQGLIEWLSDTSDIPVHIAAHREMILPGNVYVAPDEFQMGVDFSKRIMLRRDEPENNLRPAVSYLFRSVANVYGPNAIGVLLSGMGKDGALELKNMKDIGAVTIAQDAESSIVHGMPGEAILLGGATYVLSPEKIAVILKTLVNDSRL